MGKSRGCCGCGTGIILLVIVAGFFGLFGGCGSRSFGTTSKYSTSSTSNSAISATKKPTNTPTPRKASSEDNKSAKGVVGVEVTKKNPDLDSFGYRIEGKTISSQ